MAGAAAGGAPAPASASASGDIGASYLWLSGAGALALCTKGSGKCVRWSCGGGGRTGTREWGSPGDRRAHNTARPGPGEGKSESACASLAAPPFMSLFSTRLSSFLAGAGLAGGFALYQLRTDLWESHSVLAKQVRGVGGAEGGGRARGGEEGERRGGEGAPSLDARARCAPRPGPVRRAHPQPPCHWAGRGGTCPGGPDRRARGRGGWRGDSTHRRRETARRGRALNGSPPPLDRYALPHGLRLCPAPRSRGGWMPAPCRTSSRGWGAARGRVVARTAREVLLRPALFFFLLSPLSRSLPPPSSSQTEQADAFLSKRLTDLEAAVQRLESASK